MKTIALLLAIALYAGTANAAGVKLQWDPHPDPDLLHFTLYQAVAFEDHTGPWIKVKEIEKTLTTVTVTVDDVKNFAWYLTATDTAGTESGPSNVVQLYKPGPVERPTCLGIP